MNTQINLERVAGLLEDFCTEVEIREYSGRGMYGKTTMSIVCDLSPHEFIKAVAEIILSYSDDKEIVEDLAAMLISLESDSMGRQYVYY